MRLKLDIPLRADELADMLGAVNTKNQPKDHIRYVSTDTRELQPGDLFIALCGEKFNGEDYLADAKEIGAFTVGTKYEFSDFTVKDTLTSLSLFANRYKKRLSVKSTVAITGSVGKTTTKNLTVSLLSKKFVTHGTYKNLNNGIGVPLTVLSAKRDTEILVIEAGMNHSGELSAISKCIEPDISVITNVGTAHIGNLGSRKKIAEAKEEILHGMPKPFLLSPSDDPYITNYPFGKTVSCESRNADYYLLPLENKKYTFGSAYNILPEFEINSRMSHIPTCLAFALSVCSVLKMSDKEMLEALSELEFDDGKRIHKIGTITVIDDSYNASLEAVAASFKTLTEGYCGKKSAVLGDMLELGEFSNELHFKLGKLAAKHGLSKLYLFGKNCRTVKAGALSGGMREEDIFVNERVDKPELTAEQIEKNSFNETVLLKGSRGLKLERILKLLKEK